MAHRLIFLIGTTLVLSWQPSLGGETVVTDSASASQRVEEPGVGYLEVATFKYEGGRLTGANSESRLTGFTVIRIGVPDQQRTQLAVSGAFVVDMPKETNLRVVAKNHEGRLFLPSVQSVVSATGK